MSFVVSTTAAWKCLRRQQAGSGVQVRACRLCTRAEGKACGGTAASYGCANDLAVHSKNGDLGLKSRSLSDGGLAFVNPY